MFKKILQWLQRMLTAGTTVQSNETPAQILVSSEMESAISRWAMEYEGTPPWIAKDSKTLGLAAAIAAEIARMVTMEFDVSLTGSERADWIMQQLKKDLLPTLQTNVELAAALGGLVLRPFITGDGRVVIDALQGDCFYPLAFDSSRRMTAVVFTDQIVRGKKIYTRLEQHEFKNNAYRILNRCFESGHTDSLGKEISLETVPEWEGIAPETVLTNIDRPLFAYLRMPFANRVDRHSPLGVSCFAAAERLLQDADEQYGRYIWEFEGGELAIHVADDVLYKNTENGRTELAKGRERLYRGLNIGVQNENFFETFAPSLRDESIKRGFNSILQRIEFSCGLAYGTLSDPSVVEKTAEEIRASKQRSYSTVSGIQHAVQAALEDLVYAIDQLATFYHVKDSGAGAYELAVDWGDSIANDPQLRKQNFLSLVMAGKFPMQRYLVEFEGYSEDDARAAVQEAAAELNTGEPLTFEGA